ncbi:MAG: tRNA (adenine-N1)-methyltransferase [Thermoplasmata archaeon]|nr:hypothetical protein [Thermoplasmata archaeon]
MLKNQLIGLKSDKIYVLHVSGKREWINGLGVIDTSIFIDKNFGDIINILNFDFKIIKPNLEDILSNLEKGTQGINKKDIGTIIMKSGIKGDSRVVEIGIGSGFLTISILFYLVSGKLISYDISRKNAENVMEIAKHFGMEDKWEFKIRDFKDGIDENNLDAIFVDIPEPWLNFENSMKALKPGGMFIAYLPNITQVRELLNRIERQEYYRAEIIEILERSWTYGRKELRPENFGLLHTSFIVFIRSL